MGAGLESVVRAGGGSFEVVYDGRRASIGLADASPAGMRAAAADEARRAEREARLGRPDRAADCAVRCARLRALAEWVEADEARRGAEEAARTAARRKAAAEARRTRAARWDVTKCQSCGYKLERCRCGQVSCGG